MSKRAVVLFVALGVVWGIPYLLIKLAAAEFSTAALVFGRTALGAVVLLPLALKDRAFGPVLRHWKPVLAYTVAEVAVPWIALVQAERVITSGLAALLIAAVPVVGAILAFVTGRAERLGAAGMVGLGIGLAGVALLVGREATADSGPGTATALGLMALVVIGYATGPQIMDRWLGDVPASGVIVTSLAVVAVGIAPWGITQWPARVSWTAGGSLVTLALVCTTLAFVLLFALVAEVGPVRATVITYLNPAVAVVAGLVVLAEPVTPWMLLGFVAIIAGSVLVQRTPRNNPVAATVVDPASEAAAEAGHPGPEAGQRESHN